MELDLNSLKQLASTLSKYVEDTEKVALPIFAAKLAKATDAYPEDKTIGVMSNIVARMGENKMFISRSEIKDLYNKLYSRNSKFAELFSDELGTVEPVSEIKTYDRSNDDESMSIISRAYEQVIDPVLADALNTSLGNEVRGYSERIADMAKQACKRECGNNLLASVDVVSGNYDYILCRVAYQTPKGNTSVFVPVEIKNDNVLLPSVFFCNAGVEDLSKDSLMNYIGKHAGEKLVVSAENVSTVLNKLKSGDKDAISSVDMAVIKLNASKDKKADYLGDGGILYQKVDEDNQNLVINNVPYVDEEIESFAKSFDGASGNAAYSFGKDKLNHINACLRNKLASCGVSNCQISIIGSDTNTIIYAVSANFGKVAFKVPVKVEDGKIYDPEIVIANGMVEDFSKKGIGNLTGEKVDTKIAACASPLYDVKPIDLINIVRAAVDEENLAKAEDALNVLMESGDVKAYQTAFAVYRAGIGMKKEASVQTKCSMIVKNSSSIHELCGHTGLPTHKVFQDKDGNCLPMHRKAEFETDGSNFSNTKHFQF